MRAFPAIIAAVAVLIAGQAAAAAGKPPTIAIMELDYLDTSGEPADQTARHEARRITFANMLRTDLGSSGNYRVVPLDCQPGACSAGGADPVTLIDGAKRVGASYVLFGGVHKLSTLIQWAKIEILDVRANKIVFDRLLTYRGDDDEAWRRAEKFLAKDLEDQALAR